MALEEAETRTLLARFVAVAQYTGIQSRPCMFRTALCPDKCNHPTDWGMFEIKSYLEYENEGKSGDKPSAKFAFDLKGQQGHGKYKPTQAEFTAKVKALAPGDFVQLQWQHEAFKRPGVSGGERPVTEIEALTPEEGEKLAAEGQAPTA